MPYWLMALCLLSGAPVGAGESPAPGGHVHGSSTLRIRVDGPRLMIQLEGPAGNFIGFEHPPVEPEETAQLAMTLDVLRAGNNLFLTPPAAACRMASAAASPPEYQSDGRTPGHADLKASWDFRCGNPAALMWIDAQVLALFPGTKQLAASSVTPSGQKAVVLTPGTPRVLLPWPAARGNRR